MKTLSPDLGVFIAIWVLGPQSWKQQENENLDIILEGWNTDNNNKNRTTIWSSNSAPNLSIYLKETKTLIKKDIWPLSSLQNFLQ